MGAQLYSRREVRRLMAALVVFVVAPCILLVFLAWLSVRSLHEAARAQQREASRHELQDTGREVRRRLDNWLARAAGSLRALPPSVPAFWIEAQRPELARDGIRAVLALDAAGRPVGPRAGRLPADDLPRLSTVHPARADLQAARRALWGENNPARALEHYRRVVAEPRTPAGVRAALWAEMSWCAQRLGNLPVALDHYERMLAAFAEAAEAPPVLPLLQAVELAQQAGDEDRARRWALALLAACEERGLDLGLDELETVVARLPAWPEAEAEEQRAARERVVQLAAARAALENFIREQGPGPFPLPAFPGEHDFEAVPLPAAVSGGTRLLVDTRATLPGGARLACKIDPAALRAGLLEPARRELVARLGGRAEWIAPARPGTGDAAALRQPLPAPLDDWALQYRPESASLWAMLAASQSKTRAALLGGAVILALLGLLLPFVYLRRSLRVAALQADVVDRISHELKTPIASLAVLTDTLARRGAAAEPATDAQVRTLLRDEVRRLVRLSDRLLDFARQRAGTMRLDREPGRLEEWLAEIVRRLPAETGVEAGRLAFSVAPGAYAGEFDREALGEIVRNLVENAVKHGAGPVDVRLALRRVGNEAVLEVADNGPGLDARTLRHLFTPYFRADRRLAARVPGLGLGLAIVRGLVRAHGGEVTARSAPGEGAVFAIRLPLAPETGGPS